MKIFGVKHYGVDKNFLKFYIFSSKCSLYHIKLCGVNDTVESDSPVSRIPKSLTQRCQ